MFPLPPQPNNKGDATPYLRLTVLRIIFSILLFSYPPHDKLLYFRVEIYRPPKCCLQLWFLVTFFFVPLFHPCSFSSLI